MPFYDKGDVRIHYEEAGSGFPLLLIPGGGLNSTISFFNGNAPFNAIEEFKGEYRCITMDLRNANGGQSSGPLEIDRPWDAYAADQLGLMDHLGIGEFLVSGRCLPIPPWRGLRGFHTSPSGDLSVLHLLQHQLIWVGGKPMDDPEQAITEAQVLLGLSTQPGQYLSDHEDIGIPEIPFNEDLTINMKARRVLGCGWEGQIGTILGNCERVQALHQARQ